MEKTTRIRVIQHNLNKVIIEILSAKRVVSVPRRVFEKRVDVGFYEVTNPSVLPTVI